MPTVGHNDVFTLPNNLEASFLEGAHGIFVVDSRNSWHLDGDFDLANINIAELFFDNFEVLANRLPDI